VPQTVIITGAFGALGAATAKAAGARGARVALLDYASNAPAGLVESSGSGAFALGRVDLAEANAAQLAIADAAARLGSLDALVNIAGGFRFESVADGLDATWDYLFAINLKTALNASRAAIPFLKQSAHGRIVNVGALAALRAGVGMGPYTASKAAVHRLTESLAEELKGDGVTVNAVLPSTLDTPANRRDMALADFSAWVTPQEAANVILFLTSPEASAVTGALLPVRGRV
jgi:NAD(P)-dependent dehydrogenase (short-subunit alcohol dehydrogenase family)